MVAARGAGPAVLQSRRLHHAPSQRATSLSPLHVGDLLWQEGVPAAPHRHAATHRVGSTHSGLAVRPIQLHLLSLRCRTGGE